MSHRWSALQVTRRKRKRTWNNTEEEEEESEGDVLHVRQAT